MFLVSKSFVFIYLLLPMLVSIYGKNVTLTDEEIDNMIIADFSDDYVFLIMGGFRPTTHILAKHIVSVRGGSHRKFFGDNHMCGGTIISKNVVLTAAHCVVDARGKRLFSEYLVVAGTPFLFETRMTMRSYRIKKAVVNPIYTSSTMRGDFALLISEKTFEEDGLTIQRIPLTNEKPHPGMKCTSLGWGRIFPLGPKPDELLYVNLTIRKRLKCAEYYNMNPSVICASDKNDYEKGVWKGDSGGPLICNGMLTGVVSFGHTTGGPSYYASVYEHRKWILENQANKFYVEFKLFLSLVLIIFYLHM